MKEKVQLYGYQLGFLIHTEKGTSDYEMNSNCHNFDKCSKEEWDLWLEYISSVLLNISKKVVYLKSDIEKVKKCDLKVININTFVSNTYGEINNEITMLIPHIVYYYLKYDKEGVVLILLKCIKDLYDVIDKEGNSGGILTYNNGLKMFTSDLLGLKESPNFVIKTIERLQLHNDYFKIENFDITPITDIYKSQDETNTVLSESSIKKWKNREIDGRRYPYGYSSEVKSK